MFESIVGIVVLISTLCTAIVTIIGFFAKPFKFLRKKEDKKFQENFNICLKNSLPIIWEDYNEKTKAENKELLNEIKNEIIGEVQTKLDNFQNELNKLHNTDEDIENTMELLRKQAIDILRQKIENIYYEYRDARAMPLHVKENLDELFIDYKSCKGNHHIDKLYKRMSGWLTTDTLPDYDKE